MVTTRSAPRPIVRNPRVHGGEPVVRGTRVPVRSVVIAFERHGGDLARVARSFTLTPEQVRAALAYYDAHKAEIDRIIAEREQAALA
ncbi:MAG TPA: DUF433 domain-containing protein [Chloroflexota bacterium]|nr:DUF433 domain-containing protein [Chloroflexota bacterium]